MENDLTLLTPNTGLVLDLQDLFNLRLKILYTNFDCMFLTEKWLGADGPVTFTDTHQIIAFCTLPVQVKRRRHSNHPYSIIRFYGHYI